MEAFTKFGALCLLFSVVLVPLFWVFVGLECVALWSWRKGLFRTDTFAILVAAQVLSPFSYHPFLSIVPGADNKYDPSRSFYISDRECNAAATTSTFCVFLFVISVVILYLRGKQISAQRRPDFDE